MAGGDWVGFHQLAIDLASKMREHGFSSWELRVGGQAPASVAAIAYWITGVDKPYVVLPIHAFLYGLTAVAYFQIVRTIVHSSGARILGMAPLFLLPSTAMIWGQIHKDIYSICGIMLVVLNCLYVIQPRDHKPWPRIFFYAVLSLVGATLIFYPRSYLGKIVLFEESLFLLLILFRLFLGYTGAQWRRTLALLVVFASALFFQYLIGAAIDSSASVDFIQTQSELPSKSQSEVKPKHAAEPKPCVPWQRADFVPAVIDRELLKLSCTREGFISGYPSAGSNIDTNIHFENFQDYVEYIPRALEIGLFSPFPDQWWSSAIQPGGKMMRRLAAAEMLVYYFSFGGLLYLIFRRDYRMTAVTVLILTVPAVLFYALAIPNIGTLYRMRYPFFLCFTVLGFCGWAAYRAERFLRD